MSDFWEEFRAQRRQQEIQQTGRDPQGPWWASNGITPGQTITPPAQHPYVQQQQQVTNQPYGQQQEQYKTLEEAIKYKTSVDPRKVDHLKQGHDGQCPDCGNPLGFNSPSSGLERHPEAAARCFYCGFNAGRITHSVGGNLPAITDGRTYAAHQPQNGVVRASVLNPN